MAIRYGLFDSTVIVRNAGGFPVGNKAQTADFFARYFSAFIGSGICGKDKDGFRVSAGDGCSLKIAPGEAFMKGYFCFDDEERVIWYSGGAEEDREMALVLRMDLALGEIDLHTAYGEEAASLPRRDAEIYDLLLARISIPAGALSFTEEMIEDTRDDEAVCGFVTSLSYSGAEKLQNKISLSLSGGCQGNVLFDGSADTELSVAGLNMEYADAGILPVERGGTGASDGAAACINLGAAPKSHRTAPGDLTSGRIPTWAIASAGMDSLSRLRNISVCEGVPSAGLSNGEFCAVYGETGRGLYLWVGGEPVLIASPSASGEAEA